MHSGRSARLAPPSPRSCVRVCWRSRLRSCDNPLGHIHRRSIVADDCLYPVADAVRLAKQDCVPCLCRAECLRTPEKTQTRQVSFFQGMRDKTENHVDQMKIKIDSAVSKEMITRRFATVEPVFGNLRGNKRLHRFTLRGKTKVDGQWKLYCMMHNIEKLIMRDKKVGRRPVRLCIARMRLPNQQGAQ